MKQNMLTTRLFGLVLLIFLGGVQIAVGAEDHSFRMVAGGVMIKDLKVGLGHEAKSGQVATIHFTGWVDNGGVLGEAFIQVFVRKELDFRVRVVIQVPTL